MFCMKLRWLQTLLLFYLITKENRNMLMTLIHFDREIECHWWRAIEFLTKVGNAGIILNSEKFQFCHKSVEFVGFRISNECIESLYLNSIRNFHTLKSATDIRSWFGLINQILNYARLCKVMAPSGDFLSPKCNFVWAEKFTECLDWIQSDNH